MWVHSPPGPGAGLARGTVGPGHHDDSDSMIRVKPGHESSQWPSLTRIRLESPGPGSESSFGLVIPAPASGGGRRHRDLVAAAVY